MKNFILAHSQAVLKVCVETPFFYCKSAEKRVRTWISTFMSLYKVPRKHMALSWNPKNRFFRTAFGLVIRFYASEHVERRLAVQSRSQSHVSNFFEKGRIDVIMSSLCLMKHFFCENGQNSVHAQGRKHKAF